MHEKTENLCKVDVQLQIVVIKWKLFFSSVYFKYLKFWHLSYCFMAQHMEKIGKYLKPDNAFLVLRKKLTQKIKEVRAAILIWAKYRVPPTHLSHHAPPLLKWNKMSTLTNQKQNCLSWWTYNSHKYNFTMRGKYKFAYKYNSPTNVNVTALKS